MPVTTSLYTTFKKYKLKKGSFVNMEEGLDGPIVEQDFRGYKSVDQWNDLQCATFSKKVGGFTVATNCRAPDGSSEYAASDPSKHKIFVKLGRRRLKNLADYIRLVQQGVIAEQDHDSLFKFIEKQRKKVQKESKTRETVIAFNHNLDVGVLHFKFRCELNHKCRS